MAKRKYLSNAVSFPELPTRRSTIFNQFVQACHQSVTLALSSDAFIKMCLASIINPDKPILKNVDDIYSYSVWDDLLSAIHFTKKKGYYVKDIYLYNRSLWNQGWRCSKLVLSAISFESLERTQRVAVILLLLQATEKRSELFTPDEISLIRALHEVIAMRVGRVRNTEHVYLLPTVKFLAPKQKLVGLIYPKFFSRFFIILGRSYAIGHSAKPTKVETEDAIMFGKNNSSGLLESWFSLTDRCSLCNGLPVEDLKDLLDHKGRLFGSVDVPDLQRAIALIPPQPKPEEPTPVI